MNTSWMHSFRRVVKENSPAILSGAAIAGVVVTAYLAVKATPKAFGDLAVKQMDADDEEQQLSKKDVVLTAWKYYIPAGLTGIATISCIIAAQQIGFRRNAALVAAYSLTESAFREYKDQVVETIGAKKEQTIHDTIAERKVRENPPSNQVIILGKGDVTCLDGLSGRYFKSDHETIRRAANDCDAEVLQQGYCDVNKFYELVGLPSLPIGETLGWNLDHRPELLFSTTLSECDEPVLVVDFRYQPIVDYSKIF